VRLRHAGKAETAGLHLYVTLPDHVDEHALARAAHERGVLTSAQLSVLSARTSDSCACAPPSVRCSSAPRSSTSAARSSITLSVARPT